jgi:hypothetical protein
VDDKAKTTDTWRISHLPGKGRVLIANRDITAGDIVIQDTSIVR